MAATNVFSDVSPVNQAGRDEVRVIKVVSTAHTDNAFLAEAIPSDLVNQVQGMYLHSVLTVPGATAPSDNTDLTLVDSNSQDILGGAGANAIDNAANNLFFPLIDSVKASYPIYDTTLTHTIAGGATASAIAHVYYIFTKSQR